MPEDSELRYDPKHQELLWFGIMSDDDKKMLLKIYSSRKELKRANPLSGWAEAFYREPYCHQYIEAENENRPYHWMVHEATHQLNNEVSQFELPQWAEEGIACYFFYKQDVRWEDSFGSY